jgi:hypothetical protein
MSQKIRREKKKKRKEKEEKWGRRVSSGQK